MSNITYIFSENGKYVYGYLKSGHRFITDSDKLHLIQEVNFYPSYKNNKQCYLIDSKGKSLHAYLFEKKDGFEIDHINLDVLDNRTENIRYCTHQQNQINQPLQKNNTSGISGVSFYKPRKKFRARIKICQTDIHLGYFNTFDEAVQARHIGMKCMFGQYGRYSSVEKIPIEIEKTVIERCSKYRELSHNSAFFDFWEDNYE